jgi:poly(beta-D-mannuronate) lyase
MATVNAVLLLGMLLVPAQAAEGPAPASVLDLSRWKLTLPVDMQRDGSPDEIRQPQLNAYRQVQYFDVFAGGKAVVFRTPCGGVPTKGSRYPRTELREMQADGKTAANWSVADRASHVLTARLAVTRVPVRKPHVICAQIHNESDKLLAVRLEGSRLLVEGESREDTTITRDYVLGTPFTIQIAAGNGSMRLLYDGREILDWKEDRSGCYFKIGCYAQSNVESGDLPETLAEVVVYELRMRSSPP